jgi:hypothetical protein
MLCAVLCILLFSSVVLCCVVLCCVVLCCVVLWVVSIAQYTGGGKDVEIMDCVRAYIT